MFSDDMKIDMRLVCPKDVLKDASTEDSISVLEEVDSKAQERRVERRSMAGTRASSFAEKSEGKLDFKKSIVM